MKTPILVVLTGIAVAISLRASDHSSAIAMYGNIFVMIILLLSAYFSPIFRGNFNTAFAVWNGILLFWGMGILIRSVNYLGKSFGPIDTTYMWALKFLVVGIYALGLFISYKRSRQIVAV
jgi:hypothetical protein